MPFYKTTRQNPIAPRRVPRRITLWACERARGAGVDFSKEKSITFPDGERRNSATGPFTCFEFHTLGRVFEVPLSIGADLTVRFTGIGNESGSIIIIELFSLFRARLSV